MAFSYSALWGLKFFSIIFRVISSYLTGNTSRLLQRHAGLTTHREVMAVYCEDLWRSIFVMLKHTVTLCSGVFSAKQSYLLGATWHVCWRSRGAYKHPAAVRISEGTQRCYSNVILCIKLALFWTNFRTYKYRVNTKTLVDFK